MIPSISNICTKGGPNGLQPVLQLFDDKCFKIVEADKTTGKFCMGDFAFPTDGYSCVSLNVALTGNLTLFDNETVLPLTELTADTNYVRGIMIHVTYPKNDINGDEISISDKKVVVSIETVASGTYVDMPLYNFYAHFTNPRSNNHLDLINKIKITSPSALFKVDVKGLIVYGVTPEQII